MVEGTDEPLHCGVGVVSRHHDEVDDPRVAWARAWSNRDVEERVWIQRDPAGVPLRRVSHGPPNGLLAALVEGGHLGLCGERLLVVVEELVLLRRVHRLVAADVDYRAPDVVGRAAAVQQREQHGRQPRHLRSRGANAPAARTARRAPAGLQLTTSPSGQQIRTGCRLQTVRSAANGSEVDFTNREP